MLSIAIASSDVYYELGLNWLIHEILNEKIDKKLFFLPITELQNADEANVVFRDGMVTINIFKENKSVPRNKIVMNKAVMTVHVPFNCYQNTIAEITAKIRKILHIANMNYHSLTQNDAYKSIGLKKHLQLSLTEIKVMLLIGKGYNTNDISKILKRSEKTIGNHCRNAIRKMGMLNRVDFYKNASLIANCANKDRAVLCL